MITGRECTMEGEIGKIIIDVVSDVSALRHTRMAQTARESEIDTGCFEIVAEHVAGTNTQ
jgi:hypothetical protein